MPPKDAPALFSTLARVPTDSPPSPLAPSTGWSVLHLFCRVDPDLDAYTLGRAVTSVRDDGYQVIPAALLGHKADLGLMVLGADLWRLRQRRHRLSA